MKYHVRQYSVMPKLSSTQIKRYSPPVLESNYNNNPKAIYKATLKPYIKQNMKMY